MDLTDLTNPVTVALTIGIDSGSTNATAQFLRRDCIAVARFSMDLKEFADHLGLKSADYCGWSMGA